MGGMFWALDLDDFRGSFCGSGRYPLIDGLKKCLGTYTGKGALKSEDLSV